MRLSAPLPKARAIVTTGVLLACALWAGTAGGYANAAQRPAPHSTQVAALITQIETEYGQAFPAHNEAAAAHTRGMTAELSALAAELGTGQGVSADLRSLRRLLSATTFSLQVWPLPEKVSRRTERVERALLAGRTLPPPRLTLREADSQLGSLLASAELDVNRGRTGTAGIALAEGYAIFSLDLAPRLDATAPELVTATDADLWLGIDAAQHGRAGAITRAAARVSSDLHDDEGSLGQITVSRATVVSDAAIILFREGLEAVLILAAITASFTGARRRLRRPVFVGALLGLGATAVTYVLAQVIVDALGDGGQRLQAITGLIAIVVLLIVTNWFFHRMYWSEWIARFNRRRRSLEQIERLGIISGQTLGFVILGLTSVYREGFETVLFLQNLQVSAGTGATLLGVAIGLGATLIVGTLTFALGRKLPYKRMLIVTGVLIGLVLAVMVGTTVNNLQGLGWLPTSGAGFTVDPRLSQWTGFYATWEGMTAQLAALLVVYGSYAVARQWQRRRRRRAMQAPAVLVNEASP